MRSFESASSFLNPQISDRGLSAFSPLVIDRALISGLGEGRRLPPKRQLMNLPNLQVLPLSKSKILRYTNNVSLFVLEHTFLPMVLSLAVQLLGISHAGDERK